MSVTFKCAYCGKDITVESSQIHETVECEQCHSKVEVTETAAQGKKDDVSDNPSAGSSQGISSRKGSVTREEMKKSLRTWGIALIVLGIIHFAAARFLDPVWGGIIIVIGILNLCIQHRGMFVVNGTALMFVGLMNIVGSLIEGGIGWIAFGALQLWWGAMEIRKFSKYAPLFQPAVASPRTAGVTEEETHLEG